MALSAVPTSPLSRGEGFLLVDLERFQGPMDLLLHLIRQQDIDIFDIPIAKITHQFLAAVKGIREEDLDNAGEFLEMAATLVRIKAQMLLPSREEDEDEDPRAELVRRLLEYEQIREISTRLAQAEAERARLVSKGYVPPRPRPPPEDTPLESTWDDVREAALRVELPQPRGVDHAVSIRPIAMEDKIEVILENLRQAARIQFSKLVEPFKEKMHGVMTFLAGLELSRRRVVSLRQARPFAELWLYLREDGDEEGTEPEADEAAEGDRAPADDAPTPTHEQPPSTEAGEVH